jgi:hypothetical protein
VPILAAISKVEAYTVEDHLSYITDDKVRSMLRSMIDEVKTWLPNQVSVDPIKVGISLKVNGTVFAYLHMRRRSFIIATFSSDDKWTAYSVESEEDLQTHKALMKSSFEKKQK